MTSVFDSYCVVCDKQCHDSGDIYCSAACQRRETGLSAHTSTIKKPVHSLSQVPQPTYPSVLDYYMEESLDLSSDEEDSSLVGSINSLISRQPMLSYRLSLQSR